MGQMRFLAPQHEFVAPDAVDRAYLAGIEGIPWLSRNTWERDTIIIDRAIRESGCFHIPWNVDGFGECVLSTTSLMERRQPYHLPVELARGTLNRLRNQLATWQSAGLSTSTALTNHLSAAQQAFARAATSQIDPSAAASEAQRAIKLSLETIDSLARVYTQRVMTIRHRDAPKLSTLLAGNMGCKPLSEKAARAFGSAFNSAIVPISWHDIEPDEGEFNWNDVDQQIQWCRKNGLKLCGGPLLRLDKRTLPDWLYLWEDDFENLQSYVYQFISAAVGRYRGKLQIWHCAAGMNTAGAVALTEEQKLRLTVGAIDTVRRADKTTPVIVSFDQPWAEYLRTEELDLSPLHFADALVRADLGLAGIAMEINLGYWPGGTLYRDVLEFSRKIDQWSVLGLPLLIMLTIPSSAQDDPLARHSAKPQRCADGTIPSPATQSLFVQRLVPLLVSKQSVYGVIWNQFSDSQPHNFAHGGLLDAQDDPKPALSTLAAFRKAHLT
jgi:hypothetical protein